MIKLRLIFLVFFYFNSYAKIRILTFHFNRPDFIEIQYKTFKKFLRDDYEVLVFNDADNNEHKKNIEETCTKLGLKCTQIPPYIHLQNYYINRLLKNGWINNLNQEQIKTAENHPCSRHSNAVQYALENFGFNHNDIIGLLDGDMFLIRELNIRNFMEDSAIIGSWVQHKHLEWFCPCLIFLDGRKLPNLSTLSFGASFSDNEILDTGSDFIYYLRKNPEIKMKKYKWTDIIYLKNFDKRDLKNMNFNDKEINFITGYNDKLGNLHLNNNFLHYAGSSYCNDSLEKSNYIKNFINIILNN